MCDFYRGDEERDATAHLMLQKPPTAQVLEDVSTEPSDKPEVDVQTDQQ